MAATPLTSFSQSLRYWRQRRGKSQLDLATEAQTTPRHISFIETGRSRPGHELILRLARALDLQTRDTNGLLTAAGFAPAFQEHRLDAEVMRPYTGAIRALLDNHDPYPASAFDPLGRIHMTNAAHRRLFPGAEDRSPEEAIDGFYRDRAGLDFENWAEVAWAYADRWRLEASRTGNPELVRLAERAEGHLAQVRRPPPAESDGAVLTPRIRVDGQTYRTFSTVLRFDTAREVTLSEIRIELIFPADDETADLFHRIARA